MNEQVFEGDTNPQATSRDDLSEILRTHDEHLREVNNRSNRLYQQYTFQTKIATYIFWIAFLLGLLTAVGVIIASFMLLLWGPVSTFSHVFVGLAFVLGIGLALGLFLINPVRQTKQWSMDNLKIGIVYAGYMRQIYQMDATYKTLLLEQKVTPTDYEKISKQVREAMGQAMEMLNLSIDETIY